MISPTPAEALEAAAKICSDLAGDPGAPRDAYMQAARAIRAYASRLPTPEGERPPVQIGEWRTIPAEPTDEMIAAFNNYCGSYSDLDNKFSRGFIAQMLAHVIDAAPPTPSTAEADEIRFALGAEIKALREDLTKADSTAEALARVLPIGTLINAVKAADRLYGALQFIMAFYDPTQRHLDTVAWENAEKSARHLLKNVDRAMFATLETALVEAANRASAAGQDKP